MHAKTKKAHDHKRHGLHHRHNKDYKQIYWPYIPLLLLSIVVLVISFLPLSGTKKTLAYATEMSREKLLSETNAQRQANGDQALTLNEQLNKAAQTKADDMAKRNYWSHKTPEGQDPWVFLDAADYHYYKAGENLAYGFLDSKTTVAGWMNSPTHRANLLDNDYTEAGFGYANANSYQGNGHETIVVALYGRPQARGAVASTSNSAPPALENKAVSRAEALTGGQLPWITFAIGIIGGGAAVGLLINHSLRIRKFLRKGERYAVAHPLFDVALLILAIALTRLSTTVGYIH